MDSQKGIHTHAHKYTYISLSPSLSPSLPPRSGTFTHTCTWTHMARHAPQAQSQIRRWESICYPHHQDKQLSNTSVSVRLLEFLPGGVSTHCPREPRASGKKQPSTGRKRIHSPLGVVMQMNSIFSLGIYFSSGGKEG